MKKRLVLFFILTLFFASNAQAKIYIYIDQPSPDKKFPIAVPDLINLKGGEKDNLLAKIPDVLRNDLKLAGYFQVLDKSAYLENPGPGLISQEIDFKKWTAIEAHALVKGGISVSGRDLTLQFRLFDPFTGEMLVGKEYKTDTKNYRAAVHRFMDEIMLALTGEKGIFSTKITAACGRVGQREIYVMDVDGENRMAVTNNGSINVSPAWSSNGSEIAFTSYTKYFPEIFIVSANGKGKPRRVTFNNSMNITPAWAPDGSGIAISSSMSGDPELYLIDSRGNRLAQLTRNNGIDLSPTWSPDSQHLIFSSERAGNLHLFSMDRSGGNVRRLTFVGDQNDQADWSPKGDKVVFSSREGRFDIFTMNPDGSMIQRLTSGSGNNESPSFSPDGRYVVYTSTRGGKSDVYIMLWDGSNQTKITQTGGCVNPDWSPWVQ